MDRHHTVGLVVLSGAVAVCLLLGSLGWFIVAFGMLTDCTNNYGCGSSGCGPCEVTERWINVGGAVQWLLAASGVALLVRGVRRTRSPGLLVGAVAVLTASALTFIGTTWRADESYCQPGTPGYQASFCSTTT